MNLRRDCEYQPNIQAALCSLGHTFTSSFITYCSLRDKPADFEAKARESALRTQVAAVNNMSITVRGRLRSSSDITSS
jgi:hypothetical protein